MSDEELDAPDVEEEPSQRRPFFSAIFTPRSSGQPTDPELREQMRTLDPTERRFALLLVPVGLLVTSLTLRQVTTSVKIEKPEHGSCSYLHGASLVDKLCEIPIIGHASDYQLIFALGLVLCAILAVATWRSMRTLVIFTTLFMGLFAGIPGILFLGYGGWLVLRSYRLQRNGSKDAATARQRSIERSSERTAERRERRSQAKYGADESTGKASIQASKRYTPKAKPRRR